MTASAYVKAFASVCLSRRILLLSCCISSNFYRQMSYVDSSVLQILCRCLDHTVTDETSVVISVLLTGPDFQAYKAPIPG